MCGGLDGLEAFEQVESIDARDLDVENDGVRLDAADCDEGVEGVLEGGEVEASRQDASEGGEDVGVLVDSDDFGFSEAEDFGDWVAVLSKEVEDVETAESEVSSRGAEVSDFSFVRPVVDGFEVDLTEPCSVAGGEELRCVVGVFGIHRKFPFVHVAALA